VIPAGAPARLVVSPQLPRRFVAGVPLGVMGLGSVVSTLEEVMLGSKAGGKNTSQLAQLTFLLRRLGGWISV
jgi:hypothetical protein